MASNITGTTITNSKVALLTQYTLDALTNELQTFSPGLFSGADLSSPEHPVKLMNMSSQFKGQPMRGDTVNTLEFGTVTAKDKFPDTPVVNQTISATKIPLTLNTHKYVSMLQEDAADVFSNEFTMQRYAKAQAQALAIEFEKDVLALADGFSTSVGSGAGDILVNDDFAQINREFYNNGIDIGRPGQEAYAVVTPYVWETLAKSRDEYQLGGNKGLDTFNSGKILETPHGVKICRNRHYTAAGGAVKMLCITKEAIQFGFAIEPRVQKDYVLSELGELIVSDVLYGVAELRDVAGIELNYDEVNA